MQILYFYEFENFDFPPKMGDFGGNSKFLNVKPHRVTPHFEGLDLRKQTTQIRGLYLNPVKNGSRSKLALICNGAKTKIYTFPVR